MKFFFDHNMSPAMARAFRELFKKEHEIIFLAERFPRDISDIDWIAELSKEGQWVVISGDRRITRNRAEYHAFRNSNLIGLFLSEECTKRPSLSRWSAFWRSGQTL